MQLKSCELLIQEKVNDDERQLCFFTNNVRPDRNHIGLHARFWC